MLFFYERVMYTSLKGARLPRVTLDTLSLPLTMYEAEVIDVAIAQHPLRITLLHSFDTSIILSTNYLY